MTEEEKEFELPPAYIERPVIRLPAFEQAVDAVADEVPIALVYNGISHVVMMGTPSDLEDFAVGFSLSEGIITDPSQIYEMEVMPACGKGVEVRIELSPEMFWKLKDHRRSMAGRTGCGICGTESLDQVTHRYQKLGFTQKFDLALYHRNFESLKKLQVVGARTGSTHAVLACGEDGFPLGGCEDVGRHVAMDKVLGKAARNNWKIGSLFLSSRASFEMVQKAVICGVEIVFAVSAPTQKAVELAESAGLTLVAFCRRNKANVYTNPERLFGKMS